MRTEEKIAAHKMLLMEVRLRLQRVDGEALARKYLAQRGFSHEEIASVLFYMRITDPQLIGLTKAL